MFYGWFPSGVCPGGRVAYLVHASPQSTPRPHPGLQGPNPKHHKAPLMPTGYSNPQLSCKDAGTVHLDLSPNLSASMLYVSPNLPRCCMYHQPFWLGGCHQHYSQIHA
eukprot:662805-Amorphochlora_amoeboformis.AAC.1